MRLISGIGFGKLGFKDCQRRVGIASGLVHRSRPLDRASEPIEDRVGFTLGPHLAEVNAQTTTKAAAVKRLCKTALLHQ
jgi:hypothetical protein